MALQICSLPRFVCPTGAASLDDGHGFLHDPLGAYGTIGQPQVTPLESVREQPCVVLLGEPGMGKTRSLQGMTEGSPFRVDLARFATDGLLVQKVFGDGRVRGWRDDPAATLTMHLDSFDECAIRIETLASLLAEELKELPASRLKLRIACRPVAWPRSLGQRLAGIFGEAGVGTYELLPLRRRDAAAAAEAAGIDAGRFLDEVVRRELGAFAARPITLDLLLIAFAAEGRFPPTQSEIFRKGCEHLLRESNTSRREGRREGALAVPRRFELAGRLAAASLLCGTSAFHVSPEPAPNSLGVDELVDASAGTCSRSDVLEVLDTGLFSTLGPGTFAFAHRSYAEYLGACHLAASRQSPNAIFDLVTAGPDGSRGVVPHLREVAAWLATAAPGLFPMLVDADPSVLLGGDLAALAHDFRSKVVDGLLGRAREGRYLTRYSSNDWLRFARLRHPGLAAQVRPLLLDRNAIAPARLLAGDIAEACRLDNLVPDLLSVVNDVTDDYGVRVNCAYAISRIAEGDALACLGLCLTDEVGDDPQDELKGVALAALHPRLLGPAAVLPLLTRPKQSNFGGAYSAFLHGFADRIPDDHLARALDWVSETAVDLRGLGPLHDIARVVMARAFDRLNDPGVLPAYVPVLIHCMDEHIDIPGAPAGGSLRADGRRWTLFDAVLPTLCGRAGGRNLWLDVYRFVSPADIRALARRTASEPDRTVRGALVGLCVSSLAPFGDADDVHYAMSVAPDLEAALRPYTEPVGLDSEQARLSRQRYAEYLALDVRANRVPERPRIDPPPRQRVSASLDRSEAGDPAAWWRLNYDMLFSLDSPYGDEGTMDLTRLPGWIEADEPTRGRIVRAALRFLEAARLTPAPPGGQVYNDRSNAAAMRALWLLRLRDPSAFDDLGVAAWREWAPVVATFPCYSEREHRDGHRALARRAYEVAPEVVRAAVESFHASPPEGHSHLSLDLFEEILDGPLAEVFLRAITRRPVSDPYRRLQLGVLLGRGHRNTAEYLASRLNGSGEDFAEAAALMIEHAPAEAWPRVWDRILAEPEAARGMFLDLAGHGNEIVLAERLGSALAERQVADLFLWLHGAFPPAEERLITGVHRVSDRESVGNFRDRMLTALQWRGSRAAVAEMERVAEAGSDLAWVRWAAQEAVRNTLANEWSPLPPRRLFEFLEDSRKRIVTGGDQLLTVLEESLARLEAALHGETPAVEDLWNRVPAGRGRPESCTPKSEQHLSDYVKRHLEADLRDRGIVANREVEIRKRQRTDIRVDAVAPTTEGELPIVSVIIEVKGCWNRGRETDLIGQLRDRYLAESRCRHGLYVVGWFSCGAWDKEDRQSRNGPTTPVSDARPTYERLAREASHAGASIRACILDVTLR